MPATARSISLLPTNDDEAFLSPLIRDPAKRLGTRIAIEAVGR